MSDEQIFDVLCRRLNLEEKSWQAKDITSSTLRIPVKKKQVWKITSKDNTETYYLLLFPVAENGKWKLKDLKYSVEILRLLNLRYSYFPEVLNYFRAFEDDILYDVAVTKGEKADLIQNYFEDRSEMMLRSLFPALKAVGRALSELHMKKAAYRKSPKISFISFYDFWIQDFQENFEDLKLGRSVDVYLETLHKFRLEAFSKPFLTGVIHLDPGPRNLMYDRKDGRVVFLDLEGIKLSMSEKMEGVGPIALDFVTAYNFFMQALNSNQLPVQWVNHFVDSYKMFCGDYFPDESHLIYFQLLELFKSISLLKKNGMINSQTAIRKRELLERIISGGNFWTSN